MPNAGWLRNYPARWLRKDLLAGLITAAIVIPQATAYAAIAGLPVEVGLYTALTPMVVYALLGTSRVLSVSVTSTISLLTASVLAASVPQSGPGDMLIAAGTLAVLVGALLLVAGILRLGFLANFISVPVLAGFKAGIGLIIVVGQIGKALGFSVPKGDFVDTLVDTARGLGDADLASILITLLVLAILLVLPRLARRVPAALVAIAAGMLAAYLFTKTGSSVDLVGAIPAGLPSPQLPDVSLLTALLPGALGIALISFVESIAAARAFVEQDEPMVDANRELLALGSANLVGGFFQAYPGGGGTSQTAVNKSAGAKTQIAALVTAAMVALTLLVLAPLVSRIPQPALASLILVSAVGLIDLREFREIGKYRTTELVWSLVAFGGVLILGTLKGIIVAVALSFLMILYAANHPPTYRLGRRPGTNVFRSLDDHPDYETLPGLLILRTEGRMHSASMPRAREEVHRLVTEAEPRVVILECSAILDVEYSALLTMVEAERRLSKAGVSLWLAGLNPGLSRRIKASSLGRVLGDDRIFVNLHQAVEAYSRQLDE